VVAEDVSELDIGIASWGSPQKLRKTVDYIERNTVSDYRLFIVDNASPDPKVGMAIEEMAAKNPRIVPVMLETNTGYPGAVNEFIRRAETTFVAYFDNDAYVSTTGWDKKMMEKIGSFHELAMVFPNGGNYPIQRTHYTEVLWGVGFCWMLNRQRWIDVGPFDEEIGHQEEVDFQTRLRLDGWKIAALSDVHV
jgi:GT2 family glycosyltransferase